MLTPKQRSKVRQAVDRLIAATEADMFKGAGHPDDVHDIEQEMAQAKKFFERVLDQVSEPATTKVKKIS